MTKTTLSRIDVQQKPFEKLNERLVFYEGSGDKHVVCAPVISADDMVKVLGTTRRRQPFLLTAFHPTALQKETVNSWSFRPQRGARNHRPGRFFLTPLATRRPERVRSHSAKRSSHASGDDKHTRVAPSTRASESSLRMSGALRQMLRTKRPILVQRGKS